MDESFIESSGSGTVRRVIPDDLDEAGLDSSTVFSSPFSSPVPLPVLILGMKLTVAL
jgi:hypothetical protein